MRILCITCLWVVALLSVALLNSTPSYAEDATLPMDKRIKVLRFDPNDIYTIYTLYGYQTNIEFGRGETIRTISVGDRSLWQIVPSGHRLFIRPMDDEVTTNMTVITDRHTYQFDLKSGKGALRANPRLVYVARFTYPPKKSAVVPKFREPVKPPQPVSAPPAPAPASPPPPPAAKPLISLPPAEPVKTVKATSVPAVGRARNYRYTYTGFDPLAPTEIYDDGIKTMMRFANPPSSELKLFSLEQGKHVPVAYRLTGTVMTINSVHTRLLLDYGTGADGWINLFNEARFPAGM